MASEAQTYTRVSWECNECGASGFILRQADDSDVMARWRREQSHHAQQRRNKCLGGSLVWVSQLAASGTCADCLHANDEGERALTFGPVVVCTNAESFYNGKIMQTTARCESWAAPDV